MQCKECGKPLKTKNLCNECYFAFYCPFCSEYVRKEKCLGHEFLHEKENRFMADKEFISSPMFELEDKNVPR